MTLKLNILMKSNDEKIVNLLEQILKQLTKDNSKLFKNSRPIRSKRFNG